MVSRGWSPGRNLGGKAGGGVMVKILVESFSSTQESTTALHRRPDIRGWSTRPVFLQFEKDREENI